MEEYKFKFWDTKYKKWAHDILKDIKEMKIKPDKDDWLYEMDSWYTYTIKMIASFEFEAIKSGRLIPCQLEYDRPDGTEYWTNDIVRITNEDGLFIGNSKVDRKGVVHADFGDYSMTLIEWAESQDYSFEVVGTVFEIPELLK